MLVDVEGEVPLTVRSTWLVSFRTENIVPQLECRLQSCQCFYDYGDIIGVYVIIKCLLDHRWAPD